MQFRIAGLCYDAKGRALNKLSLFQVCIQVRVRFLPYHLPHPCRFRPQLVTCKRQCKGF